MIASPSLFSLATTATTSLLTRLLLSLGLLRVGSLKQQVVFIRFELFLFLFGSIPTPLQKFGNETQVQLLECAFALLRVLMLFSCGDTG